mgnify:CR=1 FL=1
MIFLICLTSNGENESPAVHQNLETLRFFSETSPSH